MTTETAAQPAAGTVQIQADYTAVKRLGRWTTATRFEIRSRRGATVLDLRSPEIPAGDIEVHLNLDRGMVKLLLADDAVIDSWDLAWTGRGKLKDPYRPADAPEGRRVRLTGNVHGGEIRVHRGGVAMLSAMFSRDYLEDCRRAHREGGMPTVDDPTREA